MIAKEALTLVKRLNDLKNSQNKQSKQLKNFMQNITQFQTRSKKIINDLNEKITGVEEELKMIRDHEKSEQDAAIKKVDKFQQSLKQLLQSYESEANQANKRLQYMMETVKEQLKISYKESVKMERNSINRLHNISNKLEFLIESTRNEQKNSIDNYQRLRNVVREKSNDFLKIQHEASAEIIKVGQKMLRKIQEAQSRMNHQLDGICMKKQAKMHQANKAVHMMIQQTTNN